MALKSVVKVSNLSNLSDARFCSGMGVELLGFGVVPGTRHYMAPEIFHEIRGWLAGPQIVGELYGLTSAAQIAEAIETYSPDYFELTWDEYTTYQKHLSLPCIIDISGSYGVAARDATDNVAYVIAGESATCRDIEDVPGRWSTWRINRARVALVASSWKVRSRHARASPAMTSWVRYSKRWRLKIEFAGGYLPFSICFFRSQRLIAS